MNKKESSSVELLCKVRDESIYKGHPRASNPVSQRIVRGNGWVELVSAPFAPALV